MEDGALTGASLVWTSDLDAQIGTGTTSIASLSAGIHTITLTATDSPGATGTDSVSVTVNLPPPPPNTLPTASIIGPADGSTFLTSEVITLSGSGNDVEDGALTGASLVWTSDLDAQIGTGATFTASLSAGIHTITLTATDSLGATGTASVSVTVSPPSPPPPAPGAGVTFDAASSAAGSRATLKWSHTVGAGGTNRMLVVGITTDTTPASRVTYRGRALTLIGARNDPDDDSRVELWYLVAPPTGTSNIVAKFDGGTDAIGGATSWTAVDQASPLGAAVFSSGEGGTAGVSVASAADEVVVDALATVDIETRTAGTGQTERWNLGEDDLGGAGSSAPGAANVDMSWAAEGFWAIGAVALKPATP